MIPRVIANSNAVWSKPPGWDSEKQGPVYDLHLHVTPPNAPNNMTGHHVYQTAWEPTPAEMDGLNAGGNVVVLLTGMQPPMAVMVSIPPVDPAALNPEHVQIRNLLEMAAPVVKAIAQGINVEPGYCAKLYEAIHETLLAFPRRTPNAG